MASVNIAGDTSGVVTLQAPSVAGSTVLTLPATSGTVMVNGPAFSAYPSAASQSLGNNVYTKIAINTEEFDTNSNFDATTNFRFTPTVAGYYQINGCVNISNSTSTRTLATIYKNNAEYKRGTDIGTTMPTTLGATVSSVIYFNGSSDYVELFVYVNAAGCTANGSNTYTTYFNGSMVRSA